MSPFIPTYTITVTSPGREPETIHVMLCPGDEPGCGPAYTDDEWDSDSPADWELTPDGWRCMGEATPGGCPGSVTVERIITNRTHAAALLESGEISSFFEIVGDENDPYAAGYEGNAYTTREAAETAIVVIRTLGTDWADASWSVREVTAQPTMDRAAAQEIADPVTARCDEDGCEWSGTIEAARYAAAQADQAYGITACPACCSLAIIEGPRARRGNVVTR